MFSTSQLEYIKNTLPTYQAQGYRYYIVYSHTNIGYGTNTEPDLIFVFSKDKIHCESLYRYSFDGEGIQISVRSGNYSTNNSGARVIQTDFTESVLNIQSYEHVFTNAHSTASTVQPDYVLASGGLNNVATEAVCFSVIVLLIVLLIRHLFR